MDGNPHAVLQHDRLKIDDLSEIVIGQACIVRKYRLESDM